MDPENSEFYVTDAATLFMDIGLSFVPVIERYLVGKQCRIFLKLRLSKRCKKQAMMNHVCKFVREYHKFAISFNPAIAFTGEDAIVCII